jgi:hypothetical protein
MFSYKSPFNNSVKSFLFADDTSLVISSYNNTQYRNHVNIFSHFLMIMIGLVQTY